MKGGLARFPTLAEHLDLGVTVAWVPRMSHAVIWAALSDFLDDFAAHGFEAWDRFEASRQGRPARVPRAGLAGEDADRLAALEARYAR